jgi:uncharacterized protein
MDKTLLAQLVCPVTKGPLIWLPDTKELVSLAAHLAYPVRDEIPVMLESEARQLYDDEYAAIRSINHPANL